MHLNWPDNNNWTAGSESDPPVASTQQFYQANPAYYVPWTWGKNERGRDCWLEPQYSLGGAPNPENAHTISDAAAAYLLPGTVINPNGLYTRETVFIGLGIRQDGMTP